MRQVIKNWFSSIKKLKKELTVCYNSTLRWVFLLNEIQRSLDRLKWLKFHKIIQYKNPFENGLLPLNPFKKKTGSTWPLNSVDSTFNGRIFTYLDYHLFYNDFYIRLRSTRSWRIQKSWFRGSRMQLGLQDPKTLKKVNISKPLFRDFQVSIKIQKSL